ncbi:MAG: T9SS type A sorting domain-containing protein [Bacteroidia bacterium]
MFIETGTLRIAQNRSVEKALIRQPAFPFEVSVSDNKVILKNNTAKNDFSLMVYDLAGKCICKKEINHNLSDVEIEIPAVENGLYLLNFKNAEFNLTKKYIIRVF